MMLGAIPPMAVFWGPHLVHLYNDAWRAFIGRKHLVTPGRPAHNSFPERWDVIGPMFAGVMAGGEGGEARS